MGSSRRQFLLWCGLAGAAAATASVAGCCGTRGSGKATTQAAAAGLKTAQRAGTALGSDVSMLVLHEDSAVGERALDAAFAELRRVERVMSIYLPDSQVSRLNSAGAVTHPNPYLVRVLEEARRMSEKSNGAFDVTVQPF